MVSADPPTPVRVMRNDAGAVIRVEEIHRGGNYVLNRKEKK